MVKTYSKMVPILNPQYEENYPEEKNKTVQLISPSEAELNANSKLFKLSDIVRRAIMRGVIWLFFAATILILARYTFEGCSSIWQIVVTCLVSAGILCITALWYCNSVVNMVKAFEANSEKQQEQIKDENKIWLTALDELESGDVNRMCWALALEKAEGSKKKAKSYYIKFRVEGRG